MWRNIDLTKIPEDTVISVDKNSTLGKYIYKYIAETKI